MRTVPNSNRPYRPHKLTRSQRALFCAVGIIPTTISGLLLLNCGCVKAGWTVELVTAGAYVWWILGRGNR